MHQMERPLHAAFRLFWAHGPVSDWNADEALKRLAAYLLALTPRALAMALSAGELTEVDGDAKDEITDS